MGPATVAGHPKRDLAKNRTPHGTRDIAVQFPCQGYHTRMGAAGEWATTPFYRLGAGGPPSVPGGLSGSSGLFYGSLGHMWRASEPRKARNARFRALVRARCVPARHRQFLTFSPYVFP